MALDGVEPSAGGGLLGRWGGHHAQLTLDGQGGRLELDCASGTLVGPVRPASDGRFSAPGTFEVHQGGPQPGDGPKASASNARYSGQVRDGVMTLSVLVEGADKPQEFSLREGVRAKLIKCY